MSQFFTISQKIYPALLKSIGKDAPEKLYYKGNLDERIFEKCLAVVGSRKMTTYGKRVTEQIVGEVASLGITIVSGFMYGIDAKAHETALKVGGKTIAVMPCGIDLIHPPYQKELYNEILAKEGLILSEYEGDFQPVNWTYPRRNRIVAGLSQAVLVVEAGERSGSLITANFAKKFKRKVFAVPGPITSEVSRGTLKLIKEGATMVTSAKDILDFYNLSSFKSQKQKRVQAEDSLEERILEALRREPLTSDELARILKIPIAQLGTKLSLMHLKGSVQQEGNKYVVAE